MLRARAGAARLQTVHPVMSQSPVSHKIRCRMIDACHRHRRAVFGVGCIPHVGRKKLRGTRTRWRTGFGDRTSNDTEAGRVFPYLKA